MEISAIVAVMSLAVVAPIPGAVDRTPAPSARTTTTAISRLSAVPSHNGVYRASLVPTSEQGSGFAARAWAVELRTATGRPVENATLALESWMPDDDRARATRPRVTAYLGHGRYRVEGLRFDGHGWWNVRLQIEAPVGNDSLAFNLVR